ncbi:unnamed protein product [Clonostachys rhizophaga]|uniref:Zn(2)-C6 fungal-type domain-containing protein n=1 Tax=Clonostachys rhizophaga TaxID=160324 RepID=A0A9N9VC94_9HYPO|nr:unnamed protein product [Clonostachys rhizophaga]
MPLSRKKSCVRCREAKTRCNQVLPTCSRCLDKNVRCVYESERLAPYPQASPRPAQRLQTPNRLHSSPIDDISPGDIFPTGEPSPPPAWNSTTGVLHGVNESSPPSGIPLEIIKEVEQNVNEDLWLLEQAENARKQKNMQLVTAPDSSLLGKAYSRRRIGGQDVLASVVLGQLKSYPRMLIEGDKLPPFIHPRCYLDEELGPACRVSGRHVCFSTELSICVSLVQMFYSKSSKNSEFVWKTIHDEGERIVQQYASFTSQQQLEGLQSVVILLLLQAEDPASVEKTGGLHLVRIVTKDVAMLTFDQGLVGQLVRYHSWRSEPENERPRRADWIWRESIRRQVILTNILTSLATISSTDSTALVLSVVDFLVEGMMGPGGSSCRASETFQKSTLPCGRDLWEARSTRAWMDSYDSLINNEGKCPFLKIQDLIVATGEREWLISPESSHDEQDKQFAIMRWCENMESLGKLIWMSLPLHLSIVKHEARTIISST